MLEFVWNIAPVLLGVGILYFIHKIHEQIMNIFFIHDDPYDCPDTLISYIAKFDEFEIIIHDGGTSGYSI